MAAAQPPVHGRLLVGSFILMDPWWTLRLGAVPFWTKFNTAPSAEALERYLDDADTGGVDEDRGLAG